MTYHNLSDPYHKIHCIHSWTYMSFAISGSSTVSSWVTGPFPHYSLILLLSPAPHPVTTATKNFWSIYNEPLMTSDHSCIKNSSLSPQILPVPILVWTTMSMFCMFFKFHRYFVLVSHSGLMCCLGGWHKISLVKWWKPYLYMNWLTCTRLQQPLL